jgi:transposase-like protein
MSQHFLLSAKARTLPLGAIMRMSDDDAHGRFEAIRFAANGGAAFCPACECTKVYAFRARKIWKCAACGKQFSVTSGTIFASRKLPIRDYLAAICIFVNAVKGVSALQLGRDLDVQYKMAFVMAHKIREAIGADRANIILTGTVEIDGAYFGGKSKEKNVKAERKDRRLAEEQTGKRQSVVVARERDGRTFTTVATSEAAAVPTIRQVVQPGVQSSMPTKLLVGIAYTLIMRCIASTIPLPTAWTAHAPTKPSPSFRGCVALRSASSTMSAGNTWAPTRARWPGRKITGGGLMGRCTRWRPAQRWDTRLAGFGLGIGSGNPNLTSERLISTNLNCGLCSQRSLGQPYPQGGLFEPLPAWGYRRSLLCIGRGFP